MGSPFSPVFKTSNTKLENIGSPFSPLPYIRSTELKYTNNHIFIINCLLNTISGWTANTSQAIGNWLANLVRHQLPEVGIVPYQKRILKIFTQQEEEIWSLPGVPTKRTISWRRCCTKLPTVATKSTSGGTLASTCEWNTLILVFS